MNLEDAMLWERIQSQKAIPRDSTYDVPKVIKFTETGWWVQGGWWEGKNELLNGERIAK